MRDVRRLDAAMSDVGGEAEWIGVALGDAAKAEYERLRTRFMSELSEFSGGEYAPVEPEWCEGFDGCSLGFDDCGTKARVVVWATDPFWNDALPHVLCTVHAKELRALVCSAQAAEARAERAMEDARYE